MPCSHLNEGNIIATSVTLPPLHPHQAGSMTPTCVYCNLIKHQCLGCERQAFLLASNPSTGPRPYKNSNQTNSKDSVQDGRSSSRDYAMVARKGHERQLAYQNIFPLMTLPQELRICILTLVAGDDYSFRENRVEPFTGLETTASLGNHMLRLESIYVALRHVRIHIRGGGDLVRTKDWLDSLDFTPLHQTGVTSLENAFDAVRNLSFICLWTQTKPINTTKAKKCGLDPANIRQEWDLVKRCANLRSLRLECDNETCALLERIKGDGSMSRIRPRSRRIKFLLGDLLELDNLRELDIIFKDRGNTYDTPTVYTSQNDQEDRFSKIITWMEAEYQRRGKKVKVTLDYQEMDDYWRWSEY